MAVTKKDLESIYEDNDTFTSIDRTCLADFFFQLSRLQESPSQRANNHKRDKSCVRKKPMLSKSNIDIDEETQFVMDIASNTRPITPQSSTPSSTQISNVSATSVTPQNKRIASDSSTASYAISSTDTTPKKLDKPEQEVQSLQNTLIDSIIKNVWQRQISIPWARNRKMWLDYVT